MPVTKLSKYLVSGSRAELRPSKPFFAIAFRHDMDGMEEGDLSRFIELHQQHPGGSTDFILKGQLKRWRARSARLLALDHEIALHSESRPCFMLGFPWATRIMESQYRRRLVNHRLSAQHYCGLPLAGHAPHDYHNFLPFKATTNWQIIGQATIRSGLIYVADWLAPSRVSSGTETFPLPNPPYLRIMGRNRVVVLPCGWDDKFFWAPWAERCLFGRKEEFLDRTLDQAWDSLRAQLETCREMRRPLIISLHPYWFTRDVLPTWELKLRALEWAAKEGVAVCKLMDLAARAAGV